VMPPDYQPIEDHWEMWVPMDTDPEHWSAHNAVNVNARLEAGATLEVAQEHFRDVVAAYYPTAGWGELSDEERAGARLAWIKDWVVGDVRTPMIVMLASVGLILLIACANVANLLLVMGGSRAREVAVRSALGASRARLVRQFLTESTLLALMGAGLGWLLAGRGLAIGLAYLPGGVPRAQHIQLDAAVLGFTILTSLLAALLFGVVPALRATRADFAESLKEGGRGQSAGSASLRLNNGLVTAEVAITVVLVVAASLMVRSFWTLINVDPGFNPSQLVAFRVSPSEERYDTEGAVLSYHAQLEETLSAIPGVTSVGAIEILPMTSGGDWTTYSTELGDVGGAFGTAFRAVSDDYFVTMQIERLSGRWFNGGDRAESPRVIIVNRSLAAHAWPEQTAVGQLLYLNVEEDPNPYTVVGVADDVRQTRLSEEAFEEVYVPLSQTTQRRMDYAVRVSTDPGAALAVLQETVRSLDPDVPISRVALAADVVGNTTSDARFFASLLAVFGALGLFLGAVGVYGVMAYTVSRRTREMGIRIALGAGSDDVLKRTLLRGMVPVGVGLAIGIPSALAAAGILRGLLYQITPADPLTFLLVPVVLTGVSILALLLPARRASRIDPVRVLKGE